MRTTNTTCVICDHPATATPTDHGNRNYIACSNEKCGDYEISNRASREVENNAERKSTLREMVCRANDSGKILDISIATDGLLQATGVDRT